LTTCSTLGRVLLDDTSLDIDPLSVDLVLVVLSHSCIHSPGVLEQDIAESAMSLQVSINHYYGIYNHAVLGEVLAQFIVVAANGESANKDLFGVVSRRCSASCGRSCGSSCGSATSNGASGRTGLFDIPHGDGSLALNLLAIKHMLFLHEGVHGFGRSESNKPESSGTTGDLVIHNGGIHNLSVSREVGNESLRSHRGRESTNKDFPLTHLGRAGLLLIGRSCVFRHLNKVKKKKSKYGPFWGLN
jgi:hypothetical protein